MLEDQSEERACLHALGLLNAEEAAEFEREAAARPELLRVSHELSDALANLALSVTPISRPAASVRDGLLARIAAEPARVTTDRWGHIQTINPAFTGLCGYTLPELLGRKPGHVLQGPATDPSGVIALRETIRTGSACEVDMVNYHKDGSPYHVHISVTPILGADLSVTGFQAVERKLAAA